jgi:hypothetical protein
VLDTIFLPVPGQHFRFGFDPTSCPYSWRLYEQDHDDESGLVPGIVVVDLFWTTQGYWVEQTQEFDPFDDPPHIDTYRVIGRDDALGKLISKGATIPAEVAPLEEVARLRVRIGAGTPPSTQV